MSSPPNWYPDPERPGELRFWDGQRWTEHRAPSPQPGPGRPTASVERPTGKWYFVITWASCGLLAPAPFFHAAAALRRASLRKVGAAYAGAVLVGFTLVGLAPEDSEGSPTGWLAQLGGVIMLLVLVGATVQQVGLRQEVYGERLPPSPPVPRSGNVTAVELVQQARARRAEARALAQRDPGMARELRIGRPDLPRHYDDGGLVDVNSTSAPAIAEACQIPPATAERLVSMREAIGGYSSVEEAIVYANAMGDAASSLRERGIVLDPLESED